MKNLFLVAMVGVFSFMSVLEAEAGRHCRRARRCGGGCYSNSGGCYTGGYTNGGCYSNAGGCYTNGGCNVNGHVHGYTEGGVYADPHAAVGPAQSEAGNAAPAAPVPAAP